MLQLYQPAPEIMESQSQEMAVEMLEAGIIQPSSSPFAYPTVLVKKKDCTWRLCVNYKHIVKDKLPFPLVEELLDELEGSIFILFFLKN